MIWIAFLVAVVALPYAFSGVALFWNAARNMRAEQKVARDNQRAALAAFERAAADLNSSQCAEVLRKEGV